MKTQAKRSSNNARCKAKSNAKQTSSQSQKTSSCR